MRTLSTIVAAVAALTSASIVSAAQFSVTDMGGLGGALGSRGVSVGSTVMVAGTSSLPDGSRNAMTSVVGGGGSVTVTPYPGLSGGANSYGMGVGGATGETLVGYAQVGNRGPYHAISAIGGATTDLHGTIIASASFTGATNSRALGINTGGEVVGQANVGSAYQAFSLSGSTVTAIPFAAGGYAGSLATAVNDGGMVVGFDYNGAWNYLLGSSITGGVSHATAFSWDGTTVADLGNLGGLDSVATAVNSAGTIVGQSTVASADQLDTRGHAFIYDGTMTRLNELSGAVMSIAESINDTGDIVGSVKTASGFKAFLYHNGAMVDLNSQIAGSGWVLTDATSINADGYITGYGLHNGAPTTFLLSPTAGAPVTPEPTSAALLGIGAVGLVSRRRRRA